MKCPNCEAIFDEVSDKFCEFCGFELSLQVKKSEESVKHNKNQVSSRRRCC